MLNMLGTQLVGRVTEAASWFHFRQLCRGEVVGVDLLPRPPYILAANHVSYLDWALLFLTFRKLVQQEIVFIAKHDLYRSRFFRTLADYSGAVIPIEQGKTSRKSMRRIRRVVYDGKVLGIFPEGTRTADGRLMKAQPGVGRLALMYDVPVVPVGLNGFYEALPRTRVVPRIHKCSIRIGAPLTFGRGDGLRARQDANAVTREVMMSIGKLTGQDYPHVHEKTIPASPCGHAITATAADAACAVAAAGGRNGLA